MMQLRPAGQRGLADHGWLVSRHTFSFADYYDPAHMGFRALRVINEDRVEAGRGFGTHSHRDMEIVSYVLEGALQHKDSMGTGSVIKPGDVQSMSAGTGVTHSELNASAAEEVHFLQIWLLPKQRGLKPSYAQKSFAEPLRRGQLCCVASDDGRQGSIVVHSDARLYAGLFDGPEQARLTLEPGRHAWVQVARGELKLNGSVLGAGDGAALSAVSELHLEQGKHSEVLVFDLG